MARSSPMRTQQAASAVLTLAMIGTMIASAAAHGLMTHPPTRQFAAWLDGQGRNAGGGVRRKAEYCPHCMNRGGVCGTSQTDSTRNYNHPTDTDGNELRPPPLMATYRAGEVIDVEFSITAHHRGHVELRMCKQWDALSQECFNEYPLKFIEDSFYGAPQDPNHPARGYMAPNDGEAYPPGTVDIPLGNGMPFKMRFQIPAEIGACEHCVLQWVYVTANTCLVDGYRSYAFPTSQWWAPYLQDCERRTGSKEYIGTLDNLPEKFWNCADVKLIAADPEPDKFFIPDVPGLIPEAPSPTSPPSSPIEGDDGESGYPSPSPLPPNGGDGVEKWGQCGGKNQCGEDTACLSCADAEFSCARGNEWYWQCRPSTWQDEGPVSTEPEQDNNDEDEDGAPGGDSSTPNFEGIIKQPAPRPKRTWIIIPSWLTSSAQSLLAGLVAAAVSAAAAIVL